MTEAKKPTVTELINEAMNAADDAESSAREAQDALRSLEKLIDEGPASDLQAANAEIERLNADPSRLDSETLREIASHLGTDFPVATMRERTLAAVVALARKVTA